MNNARRFIEHNEEVKRTVPADKLLVFEVKQGWEPLCEFLGVPVPDEPFPHVNDTQSFMEMFRDAERIGNAVIAAGVAVIAALAFAIYSRLS